MIDFMKNYLLVMVVGSGFVVSGGTGWIVKDQLQGREVLLLEAKLSDCELKVVKKSSEVVDSGDVYFERHEAYQKWLKEKIENSSGMVPKGEGY